jgi:NitT/TauT family transport system substrate-binding protein
MEGFVSAYRGERLRLAGGRLVAVLLVVALAAALLMATACGTTDTTNPTTGAAQQTIRVGEMADNGDSYLISIAQKEGYFTKYGLNVEVSQFTMGVDSLNALNTNTVDLGVAADFAFLNCVGNAQAGPSPIRAYTLLTESVPTSTEFYTTDPTVQKVADLKGKGVVVQKGTVYEYYVDKILSDNGLSVNDVKLEPVDSPLEGLALINNGSASAMWCYGQSLTKIKANANARSLGDLNTLGVTLQAFLMSTQSYLSQHGDAVQKYLQAMNDAWEFISANKTEAEQEIANDLGTTVEQVDANITADTFGFGMNDNCIKNLDAVNDWCVQNGMYSTKFDPSDYIDVSACKVALPGTVTGAFAK